MNESMMSLSFDARACVSDKRLDEWHELGRVSTRTPSVQTVAGGRAGRNWDGKNAFVWETLARTR